MKRYLNKRNALIFLAALFLLVAWNREINLLYGMFSLIAGTLTVSLLLPRYSVQSLAGSRIIPQTAFEGDEIRVEVEIENRSWRSLYLLEVVDLFPSAARDQMNPMTFVGKIRGREKKRYSYQVSCFKRGEYLIGPMKIASSYPLGVATVEKELQPNPVPFLVYPRVFEIGRLPFLRGNSALSAVSETARTGGCEDFYGTREYRRGDSLRYIHWPSSARQGRLIVKEFETMSSDEITILLDVQKGSEAGEGRETTLEYSVRIAASFARYFLGRGHGVQLVCHGKHHRIVPFGRGTPQLARIMDALARVKADGSLAYPASIQRAAELLREGGSAVLFFCRGNETRDEYSYCMELLRARRIRPVAVFMNPASFTGKRKIMPSQNGLSGEFLCTGEAVYFVSKGDALEEVFER